MEEIVPIVILVVVALVLLFLIYSTSTSSGVRAPGRLHPRPRLEQGARGPGLVLLVPFVQQAVKVDLRERFLEVPQQTCITKDNAPISIDFLVYSKVFDPSRR